MKKPQQVVPTMESTISMIKTVMDKYLPEKPNAYYTGRQGNPPERSIRWGFGLMSPVSATDTAPGEYVLTIIVRHGAFGEVKEVKERQWWSLRYVEEPDVVNALFCALTFDGSPYWFDGKKWQKRTEVM